jgi:hypothetical protein
MLCIPSLNLSLHTHSTLEVTRFGEIIHRIEGKWDIWKPGAMFEDMLCGSHHTDEYISSVCCRILLAHHGYPL